MRRVAATVLGTAMVTLMAVTAYAQTPNFAGKWTRDAEKTAAANPNIGGGGGGGRGGGMGGGDITVTQDAKTLTISRAMGENTMTTTYNLEGSPSKNMAMGRGGQTEITSTAEKVAFVPGRPFHPYGDGKNTMRLNFSYSTPDKIEEGIYRLGKVLAEKVNHHVRVTVVG